MRPSARRQLERGVSAISISAAGATWSHTADAWRSRVSNLLHISHIIDTDHTLRCVVDRLVTRDVGLTENVHLSVERFIFLDEFNRLAFRVENGPHRARAVVLVDVSSNANILFAVLHKYSGSALSFLHNFIDQIEIVVHFCRAKKHRRDLLAGNRIGPFDPGRT